MKEKILSVLFNSTPQVRCRVKVQENKDKIVFSKDGLRRTLWDDKKLFPFKLDNAVIVTVETTVRKFSFKIKEKYSWNGADIPRLCWRLIGSKQQPEFLIPSLVHDFMLEKRKFIHEEVLRKEISVKEYRRLTSLIFRQLLKENGTRTIKSNIMAWCVQTWQQTGASGQWRD